MRTWSLAFRNVWRNTRRTIATILAIALSCAGLILFGGYVAWVHFAAEVHAVSMSGHLKIFKEGFREKGSGNPAAYALENFEQLRSLLIADPVLAPKVEVVTGQLLAQGIISSAANGTSTTFMAIGVVAGDSERIDRWNPYGVTEPRTLPENREFFATGPDLDATDPEGITMGVGVGRALGFTAADVSPAQRPSVELLSLPASGGLPNVLSLEVRKLSVQAMDELDNRLVIMPIEKANELLFPGEPLHVTSALVLLRDSADLEVVRDRIVEVARQNNLALEVRSCWELNPHHLRSLQVMDMCFVFAFCIIAIVLVFTIYNTVMMSIVERTREIGALRAIGFTRSLLVKMFVLEGIALGTMGGIAGVLLGLVIAWLVNRSNFLYMPPHVNLYAKLEVMPLQAPILILGSFLACLVVACIAAYFPARRASRMEIAEALRQ